MGLRTILGLKRPYASRTGVQTTEPAETYLAQNGEIEGWLNEFDGRMIVHLCRQQSAEGIRGSIGEIGVHHGKLFVALRLCAREEESTFAIDIFEDQHLTADHTYAGSAAIFEANVRRWTGNLDRLTMIKADSQSLDSTEVLKMTGEARVVSVDGGHSQECTYSDLRLAERLVGKDGLVILDDAFNQEWPGVMAGYTEYLQSDGELRPFAVSVNKSYLARRHAHTLYQRIGQQVAAVPRSAMVYGTSVDVWQERS